MENQTEAIVRINGEEYSMDTSQFNRFEEFLAAVQGLIDPNMMIVEVLFNGNEISEAEWNGSFNRFSGGQFDIKTDTPSNFAKERFKQAPLIINAILKIIREARLCYAEGNLTKANQLMVNGVNALREFFNWFGMVAQLGDEEFNSRFKISDLVEKLVVECEKVAQAQLYQSWWGISETLKKNVEPLLDELETRLRVQNKQYHP